MRENLRVILGSIEMPNASLGGLSIELHGGGMANFISSELSVSAGAVADHALLEITYEKSVRLL